MISKYVVRNFRGTYHSSCSGTDIDLHNSRYLLAPMRLDNGHRTAYGGGGHRRWKHCRQDFAAGEGLDVDEMVCSNCPQIICAWLPGLEWRSGVYAVPKQSQDSKVSGSAAGRKPAETNHPTRDWVRFLDKLKFSSIECLIFDARTARNDAQQAESM